MYPTFTKLAAALLFAALAWYLCDMIAPRVPEGRRTDLFAPVTAALAAIVGWRILGRQASGGLGRDMAAGLSTGIVVAVLAAVFWSAWEALRLAMRGRYGGPVGTMEAAVGIAVEYGRLLRLDGEVAVLIAGSVVIGIVASALRRMEG